MSNHTPGPWNAVDGNVMATHAARSKYSGSFCVASVDTFSSNCTIDAVERNSNACLIAAAPDLLAALEDAYALLCLISNHHGSILGRTPCDTSECRKQASTAIAKAKKESENRHD